jgi:hypothetical protein
MGAEPGRGQLVPVEGRALDQVVELGMERLIVELELLRPRPGLDLGLEHQRRSSPDGAR